jgi:hypothetical protein
MESNRNYLSELLYMQFLLHFVLEFPCEILVHSNIQVGIDAARPPHILRQENMYTLLYARLKNIKLADVVRDILIALQYIAA